MQSSAEPRGDVILYVASRLPALSETFVYRELLGLRARGGMVLAASVREPSAFPADPELDALRREVLVVYSGATLRALPVAMMRHPGLMIGGVCDALASDHPTLASRLKHVAQAAMGIAAGWRLRQKGIGHVHAHMANVPAMVALYIARVIGASFSFTGHANDLFVERAALAFKLREARFVACISYWHRSFYQEIIPIEEQRLPVIRCSVCIPEMISPENKEIVSVARLVAKKGIDLLLRAFALAAPTGWTLRILGDGPERAALVALAEELGIARKLRFEGERPHAECLNAIRSAGLFVLPCRTAINGDKDGIPVVLMEAMAAGRAVIAGDLPAIRELISDGQSGVLVPPNDYVAIANAITLLTADVAHRTAVGARARAHVDAEFSDDVNLGRLGNALFRVVA